MVRLSCLIVSIFLLAPGARAQALVSTTQGTPPDAGTEIVGLVDLEGDGIAERVLVHRISGSQPVRDQSYALFSDGADGTSRLIQRLDPVLPAGLRLTRQFCGVGRITADLVPDLVFSGVVTASNNQRAWVLAVYPGRTNGTVGPGWIQAWVPIGTGALSAPPGAVADFDGDGFDDVVPPLEDQLGRFLVLRNQGGVIVPPTGTVRLVGAVSTLSDPTTSRTLVLDANGDGIPDVAMLDTDELLGMIQRQRLRVAAGDGFGGLRPPIVLVNRINGQPLRIDALHAGDVDGDGRDDLVAMVDPSGSSVTGNGYRIDVARGQDTSTGATPTTTLQPLSTAGSLPDARLVAVADLDGDGVDDIVLDRFGPRAGMRSLQLARLTPGGAWTEPVLMGPSWVGADETRKLAVVADADGDSDLDLVLTTSRATGTTTWGSLSFPTMTPEIRLLRNESVFGRPCATGREPWLATGPAWVGSGSVTFGLSEADAGAMVGLGIALQRHGATGCGLLLANDPLWPVTVIPGTADATGFAGWSFPVSAPPTFPGLQVFARGLAWSTSGRGVSLTAGRTLLLHR